jgi:phosphoglycolate phosphatase-like HAD superfamily hydrolase
MTRIVLFDIDGTLLASGGVGRRAMDGALMVHFGTIGPTHYRYDGKTDKQIVRESMRLAGFADTTIDERLPALMEEYLRRLEHTMTSGDHAVRMHLGVGALLDALEARADVMLGLLTGNVAHGASLKLRAAGLDPARFRVGAFGSDHELRPELPAIAQRRAAALLGHAVAGEALVVIGDTPADVECGRGIGAQLPVGLARLAHLGLLRRGKALLALHAAHRHAARAPEPRDLDQLGGLRDLLRHPRGQHAHLRLRAAVHRARLGARGEARGTGKSFLPPALEVHDPHLRAGGNGEAVALANLHEGLRPDARRAARIGDLARKLVDQAHVARRVCEHGRSQQSDRCKQIPKRFHGFLPSRCPDESSLVPGPGPPDRN